MHIFTSYQCVDMCVCHIRVQARCTAHVTFAVGEAVKRAV